MRLMTGAPGFAATFLVDGKPPGEGTVLKQVALAATFDQLVDAVGLKVA